MLENIVYNDLIYNGYTVNVGAFDTVEKNREGKSVRKSNEVDFYATKGLCSYYIQVTADISNAETRAREIRPYMILNDQVQKILVVNRPIGESSSIIIHLNNKSAIAFNDSKTISAVQNNLDFFTDNKDYLEELRYRVLTEDNIAVKNYAVVFDEKCGIITEEEIGLLRDRKKQIDILPEKI